MRKWGLFVSMFLELKKGSNAGGKGDGERAMAGIGQNGCTTGPIPTNASSESPDRICDSITANQALKKCSKISNHSPVVRHKAFGARFGMCGALSQAGWTRAKQKEAAPPCNTHPRGTRAQPIPSVSLRHGRSPQSYVTGCVLLISRSAPLAAPRALHEAVRRRCRCRRRPGWRDYR